MCKVSFHCMQEYDILEASPLFREDLCLIFNLHMAKDQGLHVGREHFLKWPNVFQTLSKFTSGFCALAFIFKTETVAPLKRLACCILVWLRSISEIAPCKVTMWARAALNGISALPHSCRVLSGVWGACEWYLIGHRRPTHLPTARQTVHVLPNQTKSQKVYVYFRRGWLMLKRKTSCIVCSVWEVLHNTFVDLCG